MSDKTLGFTQVEPAKAEVHKQAHAVEYSVGQLQGHLDDLFKNLIPVLLPANEGPATACDHEARAEESPLAEQLIRINSDLQAAIDAVKEIKRRLQI